ncbi:NUDIX hydrolase [Methylobacterium mesophilicum]|uniref:NUDIX hydrolase n=1 Tax=Methylobacterium mesophilicum TaxID=39956 RepID=UPI002F2CFD6A
MNSGDRFVLGAVIVGFAVNIASNIMGAMAPELSKWVSIALAVSVLGYFIYRTAQMIINYLYFGRFAALVYFLGNDNRLLLIKHPYHRRYLPPGGRLKYGETPDQAVANRLREETGIVNFEYHPIFHATYRPVSDLVEEVPRPYAVQREHRRQRGGVRSHYDFIYVCKFASREEIISNSSIYHARWASYDELTRMEMDVRPFDDVVTMYSRIIMMIQAHAREGE